MDLFIPPTKSFPAIRANFFSGGGSAFLYSQQMPGGTCYTLQHGASNPFWAKGRRKLRFGDEAIVTSRLANQIHSEAFWQDYGASELKRRALQSGCVVSLPGVTHSDITVDPRL